MEEMAFGDHSRKHGLWHPHSSVPDSPTTDGSRSIKMALGTYFPVPVSVKKVPKDVSAREAALDACTVPSGRKPCSKQYSSQQELPIWTPACPM